MPHNRKITDLYKKEIASKSKKYLYLVIDIEPYSKSNSLYYGNRRAYIPKKLKDCDIIVANAVREHMLKKKLSIFDGPVIMQIDGYYKTKRVVDAPNLSKSICDALNDLAYYDDRQIVYCATTKNYDKHNPRVEIYIEQLPIEHDLVNMKPMLDKAAKPPKLVKATKTGTKVRKKSGTRKRIKKQKKK